MPAWSTLDLVAQGVVDKPVTIEVALIISLFWKDWKCFACGTLDCGNCIGGKKIFLHTPVQLFCQCNCQQ